MGKRYKHRALPKGVKLGKVHEGRIWVVHPTKGLRSRVVRVPSLEPTGIRLLDIFRHICRKVLDNV